MVHEYIRDSRDDKLGKENVRGSQLMKRTHQENLALKHPLSYQNSTVLETI
jgi:hypothetical protein